MRSILLAVVLIIGGGSTPYQQMGFSGGVDTQQITADTYRIVARGNASTSSTRIQDYTLLKAAETTRAAGGTHFAIVSAADASSVGQITTGGTAQTTFVGNMATTTYNPPTTHHYVKPGQDTYIRVLNITPGQAPPRGAYSADEIIQHVGARVKQYAERPIEGGVVGAILAMSSD